MADYTTPDAVRGMIDKQWVNQDDIIEAVITAISRAIDNKCNRPDGFVASETATPRLFVGSGSGVLQIDEAAAITAVGIKASATDSDYVSWDTDTWLPFGGDMQFPDFNHTPYTGIMSAAGAGLVFTSPWGSDEWSWPSGRRGLSPRRARGTPTVQVTAKWGYGLTVPAPIAQACIIETARMFKRGLSGYADTLASPDLGGLIQLAKLDPSTVFLLEQGRYVRAALG